MSQFHFVPRAAAVAAATFALSLSASSPANAFGAPVPSDPPYPAPGCAAGTLATYQTSGANGCTVGPATFYDFTQVLQFVDGTQTSFDPAPAINVAPGLDTSAPALRFSSLLFNRLLETTDADYYFEYYIDPPIDILGFQLSDLPFVGNSYVEASVCVSGRFGPFGGVTSGEGGAGIPSYGGGEGGAPTFSGGEGAFSPASDCIGGDSSESRGFRAAAGTAALVFDPQYYYFNIQDGQGIDTQNFAQSGQFVDTLIHVHISAGGLVPDFGTGALVVPEPAEWTLTAFGGLALAGALRRKRRRAPAAPVSTVNIHD